MWCRAPRRVAAWVVRKDGLMELRIFIEPQQGASYATQLRMAQAAEELGYGAFFRSTT